MLPLRPLNLSLVPMLPGKVLYQLFPRLTLGTHCTINRLAYHTLRPLWPRRTLPRLHLINHWEGFNGVDGLWLNNRHLPSQSAYNPVTGQGNGLRELARQFRLLQQAQAKRRRRRIARRLAYVSHIIADVCTPPHQHGQIITVRQERWYWFWLLRDDWAEDNGTAYFVHRHSAFEIMLLLSLARQPLTATTIDYGLVRRCQGQADPTPLIVDYIKTVVTSIRALNLYTEYMSLGWTDHIASAVRQQVFPNIIRAVATIWYVSYVGRIAPLLRTTHL